MREFLKILELIVSGLSVTHNRWSTLQNINITSTAKHMDSYDFSTLYTSIPHASLKNNINILIDEAFKVRGAQYLVLQ